MKRKDPPRGKREKVGSGKSGRNGRGPPNVIRLTFARNRQRELLQSLEWHERFNPKVAARSVYDANPTPENFESLVRTSLAAV